MANLEKQRPIPAVGEREMILNELYLQVTEVLLEPGGFQTQIWTVQSFLDAYRDVVVDFLQRTGMYKKITCVVQEFGIGQYTFQDFCAEIQHMFSDEKALFRGDVDDLDAAMHDWIGQVRTPQQWRDDQLPMKTAEVYPAPAINGNEFTTPNPNGYLGTLSKVIGGDVDIVAQTSPVVIPFLGTISRNDGTMYLESAGPFLGTIANIIETKTNIAAVATATLFNQPVTLNSTIELVHDSFVPFLKAGILAKLKSCDSEGKDDLGAKFCAELYENGIELGKAIMEEAMMQEAA